MAQLQFWRWISIINLNIADEKLTCDTVMVFLCFNKMSKEDPVNQSSILLPQDYKFQAIQDSFNSVTMATHNESQYGSLSIQGNQLSPLKSP